MPCLPLAASRDLDHVVVKHKDFGALWRKIKTMYKSQIRRHISYWWRTGVLDGESYSMGCDKCPKHSDDEVMNL